MTQATRVGELTFSDYLQRGIREGAMWALICVALYLVLALASRPGETAVVVLEPSPESAS